MGETASSAGLIGAVEDQMATSDLAATFQAFEDINALRDAEEALQRTVTPPETGKDFLMLINPFALFRDGIKMHFQERQVRRLTGPAIVARGHINLTNKRTEG
jgi:hypothetical protein